MTLCNIKIEDPCVRLSVFSGFKKCNSVGKRNEVYQREMTANVGKETRHKIELTDLLLTGCTINYFVSLLVG